MIVARRQSRSSRSRRRGAWRRASSSSDELLELVVAALGLDERTVDGGAARGEHAIARRDDRVERSSIGRAPGRSRRAKKSPSELYAREIELGLVEVRADRARKRSIRCVSQRYRQPSTRGQSDQRRVDGSWLAGIPRGYSASPPGSRVAHTRPGYLKILPGVAPSYKSLAVVVELELGRNRAQPDVIRLSSRVL